MFTSQQSVFCITVVEDVWGTHVDGCDILLVRASTSIYLIVTLQVRPGYVQDRYTPLRKCPWP